MNPEEKENSSNLELLKKKSIIKVEENDKAPPAVGQIIDKNNQYKKLNPGDSISIPILCEYFMDYDNLNKDIYKTIAFSLQTSLTKDIDNYIFKIVISNKLKYNSTQEKIYIPLLSSEIF